VLPQLDEIEARVIGCLIEKSIVTPDQYPLTLNALTNACNQKSSRDPVMSLKPGAVQHAIRALELKHLVRTEENFKSRTEKYAQRFCNTRYSEQQFDPAQLENIDMTEGVRDSLRGLGWKSHWLHDKAAVAARRAEMEREASMAKGMSTLADVAEVAEKGGKGAQAIIAADQA